MPHERLLLDTYAEALRGDAAELRPEQRQALDLAEWLYRNFLTAEQQREFMAKTGWVMDDEPPQASPSSPGRRGRPASDAAKSSDPDYTPTTVYVRRDLYAEVRAILLRDGRGQDFSDLIDQLLADWLEEQQSIIG